MKYLIRSLIVAALVFTAANNGWAGVYNNSGTSAEDSICFVGINISADGRRALSVTAASDSLYVLVFYPGGALAFRDSCLMNDSKITIAAFEDQAAVSAFSYKNSVANVDGGGQNGTYKVVWSIRDVDSANTTFGISEAQVFSTGVDVSYSQALSDANSLTFTVANEVNANMRYYEGADGVDAEIQSEALDAINSAFTFDLSGNVAADVQDWGNNDITPQVTGNFPNVDMQGLDGDVTTAIAGLKEAFDNDDVFSTGGFEAAVDLDAATGTLSDAQVDAITVAVGTIVTGAIDDAAIADGAIDWGGELDTTGFGSNARDAIWKAGIKTTQAGDADSTFADAFVNTGGQAYAIIDVDTSGGTLDAAQIGTDAITAAKIAADAIGASELAGTAAKEIADSTWNDWISSNTHDSTFGGAFTIGGAAVRANYDSSYGTIANSQVDDDVDVNVKTASTGAIEDQDVDDLTVNIKAADTVTVVNNVLNINSADTLSLVNNVANINSADTLQLVNNVLNINSADTLARVNSTDAGDTIRAHAPHGNNWASTGSGGSGTCDNGNGAQTVTIKVADTSGTYAVVVGARVSVILNNTSYWALTNGSGIATLYLDPASYTAYASMNGYNFTAKSITVPSSSYADSILGYDVTTNGTAIASSQQVTLYDWALSPANDTLYGAKVTITLVGSANFYTSTHLVPAASIVIYAGANDGTSNGGKWQKTIFGTDSLFAPGGAAATYNIEIEHPLLDRSGQKIVYRNLTIPASATATRLRSIVAQQ